MIIFLIKILLLYYCNISFSIPSGNCKNGWNGGGICIQFIQKSNCTKGMLIGINRDLIFKGRPLSMLDRLTPYTVTVQEIMTGKPRRPAISKAKTRESSHDITPFDDSLKWKFICARDAHKKAFKNSKIVLSIIATGVINNYCRNPYLISREGVISCRSCDPDRSIPIKEMATGARVCIRIEEMHKYPVIMRARDRPTLLISNMKTPFSFDYQLSDSLKISTQSVARLEGFPIDKTFFGKIKDEFLFRLQPVSGDDSVRTATFILKSYTDKSCLLPVSSKRLNATSPRSSSLDPVFLACDIDGAVAPFWTYNEKHGMMQLSHDGLYYMAEEEETRNLVLAVNPDTNWNTPYFEANKMSLDFYSNFRIR